ncbi:hypothetical protein EAI89_06860 [Eubacterium sp. am_0171]|nr:hypothetical protein EAI89_06860 [Eubacterium sp. am_0171]
MVKQIYQKSLLKKGGCRVVAFAAPGMYYEKVYSNSIAPVIECQYQMFCSSFDIFSIFKRNEESMSRK